MRRALFTFVLALSLPAAARSQTAIGQVVSASTRRPLAGVRVALVDDSARVVAVATTDSSLGAFFVDAPRPGRYRVALYTATGASFVSPPMMLDSAASLQQVFSVPEIPTRFAGVMVATQVTKPAVFRPGYGGPRFPDVLKQRGVRGSVAIAVVIDSTGRPEVDSMEVLFSTDARFSEAVKWSLERARFFPAELNGVRVPQIAQITYGFRFAGDSLPGGDVVTTAQAMTRRVEIRTDTIRVPMGGVMTRPPYP